MRVPEVIKAIPRGNISFWRIITLAPFRATPARPEPLQLYPDYLPYGAENRKKYVDVDVYFLSAGAMDSRGYFNFGLANSVSSAVISKAKKIVVEVNDKIPYCLGGNQESLHISRVDYIDRE
jgi:acyl-CoA hydrolase